MKNGHELIEIERKRQISDEGYSEKEDSAKYMGLRSLEYAAEAYEYSDINKWPWDIKYYKPSPNDLIKQRVKSGALYQAEVDRLREVLKDPFRRRKQVELRLNDMINSVDRVAMKINNLLKLNP